MPKIIAVEANPYNVPLSSGLSWGKGHHLATLQHVLIRIILSDGAEGIAESTPRPTIYGETQASVQAMIEHHLAPILLGEDLNTRKDIDLLDQQLSIIKNNHTAKGALNMALHLALAQSKEHSIRDWLGITKKQVRVSYIVGTGDENTVIADVNEAYQVGVRVFKVKIGKNLTQEIQIIQALQLQFPDAEFYADANQCLTIENGESQLNHLYELGILWCEEPLPVHLLNERHQLRQITKMPIIADDSAFTLEETKREIAFDTFDILNIKTARTGFSQSQAMLNASIQADKQVMVGSQASSLLGCLHTALFAGLDGIDCASECTFFLKIDSDLAIPIIDGCLDLDIAEMTLEQLSWQTMTQERF
ncbi:MAG: enolase C-terminal domain-like protein [Phototrophicaceae bacterium]